MRAPSGLWQHPGGRKLQAGSGLLGLEGGSPARRVPRGSGHAGLASRPLAAPRNPPPQPWLHVTPRQLVLQGGRGPLGKRVRDLRLRLRSCICQ